MRATPAEAGHPKRTGSIPQLAQKALDAGYRITPIYSSGALGAYKDGQDYSDLSASSWAGAVAVGVILDRMVLLDYDGNKADASGTEIVALDRLAALMGVADMPEPAQVGSNGRSVHYLFKLPAGYVAGGNLLHSNDGFEPNLDVKCGNQVMHLKPGKKLGELHTLDRLPVAPQSLLEALKKDNKGVSGVSGGVALQRAVSDIKSGTNLHGAGRTISAHMMSVGQTELEVRMFFERLRDDIVATRGSERAERFFNGELTSLIDGAPRKEVTVPFEPVVTPWEDWVYVAHEDKFKRLSSSASVKPAAFNMLMAEEDTFVGKRKFTPAKYAREVAGVRAVQYSMYAPQFGQFFNYDGDDCVNTYRLESVPKAASVWSELYQQHLEMLFPYDHKVIVQWMAWVVRNHGRKVLWALLLKGVQGDGKSTVARMMKAAMGLANTREISMSELNSEFSSWSSGHCLGIIEEVRVSGQNRHKVMDKLKPLITNPEINVVRKGQDGHTVLNTANYMLLTNHDDALALDNGDRRYGVFFTQFEDREALPHADYWDKLHRAINDRPEEVRGWLESIDLSDFDPMRAPAMTEAKRKMMFASRGYDVDTLAEAIALGGAGIHEMTFSCTAINKSIVENHLGKALNTSAMTKAADVLGYEKLSKPVKWNGITHRGYIKKGSHLEPFNKEIREFWDTYSSFDAE